ncbi:GIY-YIG nuclease family protein [Halorarius litoreus]|uniref:GIY-YIG nuclease family protein n=1 Tax=Halorarius litoreus TaxID=2962676 RepID=UPI0020CF5EDA|nr:GIY-YIG nuclease family protein [Halorarius litoreus]
MTGGTYTLLVELPEGTTIEVGALGSHAFPAGWYAYTGSALGTGGFSRVDRHHDLAAGDREVRHWHVDYLLGQPETRIVADARTAVDAECLVAAALPDGPVSGFGASDCDCRSHLAYASEHDVLQTAVRDAHDRAARG